MKKLILLAAVLAMVLLASAPVIAQEVGFDDQELESGDIESETSLSIEGNNNNQCVGLSQVNNTGNFANQQGTSEFGDFDGTDFFFGNGNDNEFVGPETTFSPENETDCGDQAVQQASTASSWESWW